MDDPSPAEPAFWNLRYTARQTPWDLGRVPPALERFLNRHPGEGRRALVPGCGSGHEISAFVAAGYHVTAIDFSEAAIARVRAQSATLATVECICSDFFAAPWAGGTFDLVYERTFLCALPLARRTDLVARTAHLLKPGGVLAGLYFYGPKDDGPPFGLEAAEAEALFNPSFELIADTPVPAAETLPLFVDCERWQERRRRLQL